LEFNLRHMCAPQNVNSVRVKMLNGVRLMPADSMRAAIERDVGTVRRGSSTIKLPRYRGDAEGGVMAAPGTKRPIQNVRFPAANGG